MKKLLCALLLLPLPLFAADATGVWKATSPRGRTASQTSR